MDDGYRPNGLLIDETLFYADGMPGDDRLFYLDGREFRTISELAEYMRHLLDSSFMDFKRVCRKLVDYDGELDAQFNAWLIRLGKDKELEEWRASI